MAINIKMTEKFYKIKQITITHIWKKKVKKVQNNL